MNKILELSKPKGNTVDEKKEKSELINEIKQREEDAAEFINKLYKTNEAGTINEYVTSIESLDFVKKQIEQLKIDFPEFFAEEASRLLELLEVEEFRTCDLKVTKF